MYYEILDYLLIKSGFLWTKMIVPLHLFFKNLYFRPKKRGILALLKILFRIPSLFIVRISHLLHTYVIAENHGI